MKYKFYYALTLILTSFLLSSCDSDEPTKYSEIIPIPLGKINSITVTNNFVVVNADYITSNSCWEYYKTEITGNDTTIYLKVYAQYEGQNCTPFVVSITHIDTIYFSRAGFKKIRFWQSDSLYKDTTIVFAANYNITFPDFFVEKGYDADSSYISLRGTKINPFVFEIETTGWGIIETGITHSINYSSNRIMIYMMGECGTVLTRTWEKASRKLIFTADVLDTVNTIAFTNSFRNTDTIVVNR